MPDWIKGEYGDTLQVLMPFDPTEGSAVTLKVRPPGRDTWVEWPVNAFDATKVEHVTTPSDLTQVGLYHGAVEVAYAGSARLRKALFSFYVSDPG
jgi:hypothetical protein